MKILPDFKLGPDYISSNTWRLSYSEGYKAWNEFMILQIPLLRYRYLVADEDIMRFLDPAISLRLSDKGLWVPPDPVATHSQPFAWHVLQYEQKVLSQHAVELFHL